MQENFIKIWQLFIMSWNAIRLEQNIKRENFEMYIARLFLDKSNHLVLQFCDMVARLYVWFCDFIELNVYDVIKSL